jgi:hypothetical protein
MLGSKAATKNSAVEHIGQLCEASVDDGRSVSKVELYPKDADNYEEQC